MAKAVFFHNASHVRENFELELSDLLGIRQPAYGVLVQQTQKRVQHGTESWLFGVLQMRFVAVLVLSMFLLHVAVHAEVDDPQRTVPPDAKSKKEEVPPPLSNEQRKRVEAALPDLANDDFEVRESASRTIKAMGVSVIPLLDEKLKSETLEAEVHARCEEIIVDLHCCSSPKECWVSLKKALKNSDLREVAANCTPGAFRKLRTADAGGTPVSLAETEASWKAFRLVWREIDTIQPNVVAYEPRSITCADVITNNYVLTFTFDGKRWLFDGLDRPDDGAGGG